MDIADRRRHYLASGDNEIDTGGRDAEIEYKNFLLEYVLSERSFNDLDEDLFDFKDADEEERIIREKAAFLFRKVIDPETLKAVFDLTEAVFNFVAISDIPKRIEIGIETSSKRNGTQGGRSARLARQHAAMAEREAYVMQVLENYGPWKADYSTAAKIAHKLDKLLKGIDPRPNFPKSINALQRTLEDIAKKQAKASA